MPAAFPGEGGEGGVLGRFRRLRRRVCMARRATFRKRNWGGCPSGGQRTSIQPACLRLASPAMSDVATVEPGCVTQVLPSRS